MSMFQFWSLVSGAINEESSLSAGEADELWAWLKAS
jgi:hypothetical protein